MLEAETTTMKVEKRAEIIKLLAVPTGFFNGHVDFLDGSEVFCLLVCCSIGGRKISNFSIWILNLTQG